MVKIRKYTNCIERFIHGEKGQRFFNFTYSIGAAIVIWGALFKILHLPWGNTLLCIGMGTEIAMFILTAFDRPPKDFSWDEFYEHVGDHPGHHNYMEGPVNVGSSGYAAQPVNMDQPVTSGFVGQSDFVGQPGYAGQPGYVGQPVVVEQPQYTEALEVISEQMRQLQETTRALTEMNSILLHSYESVNRSLNDIKEMYEKSAGEATDYCEEMARMTGNMRELNSIYERMLGAMTVNMGASGRKEREQ